jgi:hypothetical protein
LKNEKEVTYQGRKDRNFECEKEVTAREVKTGILK